jgi:hypothetical protein
MNESIFNDARYFFKSGEVAGKENRSQIETKAQAIQQAKAEFNRRKLMKHEAAFVQGFVSSIRGGYFTEKDHIEAV